MNNIIGFHTLRDGKDFDLDILMRFICKLPQKGAKLTKLYFAENPLFRLSQCSSLD